MVNCGTCGAAIVFGGKRNGGLHYCNDKCLQEPQISQLALEVPQADALEEARNIVRGSCPECGDSEAPVGVWVAHRAVSVVIATQWSSHPAICCAWCGRKALVLNTLVTLLLGWWGFPFGVLITPIQIFRNVFGLTPWVDHADPNSLAVLGMAARKLARERFERGELPAVVLQRQASRDSRGGHGLAYQLGRLLRRLASARQSKA